MPKPVYRKKTGENRQKFRNFNELRSKWICSDCGAVHIGYTRPRCRNPGCKMYDVEGLLSADDPLRKKRRRNK